MTKINKILEENHIKYNNKDYELLEKKLQNITIKIMNYLRKKLQNNRKNKV